MIPSLEQHETEERGALLSYFNRLVNRLFKIIPMKEADEATLETYLQGLQIELVGFSNLPLSTFKNNPSYISLLSILQYLVDNANSCPFDVLRREVFTAISICNQLEDLCKCDEQDEGVCK